MLYPIIVKFRARILVFLMHNLALPVLQLTRKPQLFPYDAPELAVFPEGSLGKDLVGMLQHKGLQLLPYYAKHNIKYASFPVLITVVFGCITMPEH